MTPRALAITALLAGCATSPPTPDASSAGPKADDGSAGLAEEHDIWARVRRGEGDKVRAELQARAEQTPDDKHLAFLQVVPGMPSEESWKTFKRQSDDAPTDPWPVVAMGQIYIDWKMYPEAQKTFAKAAEVRSGFVPAELGLADVQRLTGDPGAKAAYQSILQQDDLPEAHAGLGLLAISAGDTATAQKELAIAVKGDPSALDPLRALGKLQLASGDPAGALASFKTVVAMDPKDGDAQYQLAKLEESQGDVAGATAAYTKAAEIKGIDVDIATHLLALADKGGDLKGQEHALDVLAHVDKQNPAPLVRLASMAADRKDAPAAEARYKEALERAPGNADIELALARLYRDTGRTQDALDAYRALATSASAPPAAKPELDALLAPLKLSANPISGDINRINMRFGLDLNRFYQERLKEKPGLKGNFRIEVDVDKDGKITAVVIQQDTVKDDLLHLHAYATMAQAQFPKAARKPVFEYELKP